MIFINMGLPIQDISPLTQISAVIILSYGTYNIYISNINMERSYFQGRFQKQFFAFCIGK